MNEVGLGAGLGAAGFWIFIGMVVWATLWSDAKKKESQQATLRQLMERDEPLDEETINRYLSASEDDPAMAQRELKVSLTIAAIIMFFLAPGLLVLGWAVGAFSQLLGVAGLLLFLGAGMLVAANVTEKFFRQD